MGGNKRERNDETDFDPSYTQVRGPERKDNGNRPEKIGILSN